LIGAKRELFRNDKPWEGNLVEGVSMIRNGDYFYAFYAAAGCCGAGCDYKTGVARAKNLMGPWEKYSKNPILLDNGPWKCPGHGTPIKKDNKFYFMYHAYDTAGYINTGRQSLLQEFRFLPDGWIEFVNGQAPGSQIMPRRRDDFNGDKLSGDWQWSVFQNINKKVKKGRLELNGLPEASGAFLGQQPYTTDYNSTVKIVRRKSKAAAGIALIGDEKNIVSAQVKGSNVYITQVKDGRDSILSTHNIPRGKKGILQMQVRNGKDITFLYGKDQGTFTSLNTKKIDGKYLPPWDRGLRVGVVSKGSVDQKAIFDSFEITEISKIN
jgi:beta-xylosidase